MSPRRLRYHTTGKFYQTSVTSLASWKVMESKSYIWENSAKCKWCESLSDCLVVGTLSKECWHRLYSVKYPYGNERRKSKPQVTKYQWGYKISRSLQERAAITNQTDKNNIRFPKSHNKTPTGKPKCTLSSWMFITFNETFRYWSFSYCSIGKLWSINYYEDVMDSSDPCVSCWCWCSGV